MSQIIHPTPLAAKIAARNRAHALALEITPIVITALLPWKGKKIVNATGGRSKKFDAAMPNLRQWEEWPRTQIRFSASVYSLWLNIKTEESYRGRQPHSIHATYQEVEVSLGSIEDFILKDIYMNNDLSLRTDYKVEDVELIRAQLIEAEKAVRDLESKLYFFGRTDS